MSYALLMTSIGFSLFAIVASLLSYEKTRDWMIAVLCCCVIVGSFLYLQDYILRDMKAHHKFCIDNAWEPPQCQGY